VDADFGKVMSKPRLEKRARLFIEPTPRRTENVVNDGRRFRARRERRKRLSANSLFFIILAGAFTAETRRDGRPREGVL
jgi:hypothetical protein